jgi:hypothetical protein
MLDRPSTLPGSIQEIADVIGRDEALAFIDQLPVSGGRTWRKCVYIPKTMPLEHQLVGMLGWRNAQKMSRAFSGMILQPSNCRFLHRNHRNRQILRMKGEGMPVADIADLVELSIYRVREIINLHSTKREAVHD